LEKDGSIDELFPPSDDSEIDLEEQDGPMDLNEAITAALVSHSIRTSPADCPSSKGYGDSVESTRSEKSGASSWSLLGVWGLEGVQVSTHRVPPTDRPPDKPLPWKGASGGACWRGQAPDTLASWLP
jgi:hypothetical protein